MHPKVSRSRSATHLGCGVRVRTPCEKYPRKTTYESVLFGIVWYCTGREDFQGGNSGSRQIALFVSCSRFDGDFIYLNNSSTMASLFDVGILSPTPHLIFCKSFRVGRPRERKMWRGGIVACPTSLVCPCRTVSACPPFELKSQIFVPPVGGAPSPFHPLTECRVVRRRPLSFARVDC